MEGTKLKDDLLEGAEAIRSYLGWESVRKVYYAAERKHLPIWQAEGGQGSSRLITTKSALRRHFDSKISAETAA
jgi:hypothetical protein